MTETQETPVLTAEDRCDRCGAQGVVLLMLPSGGVLLFCGHHARMHAFGLADAGADVLVDERKV